MSTPLFQVRNVGWRAGSVDVLRDVSLAVAAGEFVAIMGRNGAGKSTLLDIVGGLRTATRGVLLIRDRPLGSLSATERALAIAHLPQNLRTDVTMRAESLVLMGRYARASQWFETDADLEVAHAAMRRCDCWNHRERPLGTLSGGERQRVYLAACLAQQPQLLLLDEPTTFLDIDQQLACFTLLRDEACRGTACLAVTHDINLALTFCSRIVVLDHGVVTHDVHSAKALDDHEWLGMLSDRLRVERSATASAWVRYQ